MHEIFQKLQHIIFEQMGTDKEFITLETPLKELGLNDEWELACLTLPIEEDFKIEDIPVTDADNWDTVQDIVNYIKGKV